MMMAAGSEWRGTGVAEDESSGHGLEHTSCGAWIFFEGHDGPVKNMNRRVASRRKTTPE